MPRLSSLASAGQRRKLVATLTAFQQLILTKVPWGQYSAASWNSATNTLPELTGNGRNATTANLTTGTAAGNGAAATIPYITGSATTGTILWPAGSIPAVYTICAITRYSGVGATQQCILKSSSTYWLQGHYDYRRGIAYNGTAWRTAQPTVGTLTNWLNCCTTTSAVSPNNVLVDGVGVGFAVGGSGVVSAMAINLGAGAKSDFQFSQLLIWDQELTATELAVVSAALTNYLSTGVLQ